MPRKLKTYQTSLGFYDLAIAAPSMKAALEAWCAGSNLFHQGHATETEDPDVVAATMAKPGVVLKRPAGSSGRFAEHADLPDVDEGAKPKKSRRPEPKRRAAPKASVEDSQKAAAAFEREQKRRDVERRKEEAAWEKERARREKLVDKAQAALDAAQREHEERSEALDAERRDVEKRIEAEDARWEAERETLRDALRRTRE
ncbi:cell envelope biogenesis protein TolA [Bradyrhizobium sp. CIAT3101]|uniref:cell envelope biogenesis protein TolA n=1 Tax=Bradyrhizobium sp. CIAT3101 TaxID=439387 RepID=UPI0024B04BFF|nr:cell envelope biogenesis protein TolA [Bradyrhizobium sp. CIAT3101]WFU82599.1 cell envelope biogenesis protein TolA [Bradyrhizobium sp. CIAT3101]